MTLNPAQDKFVLKRQLTPSPGFAKTAPYLPSAGTHFRLKHLDSNRRWRQVTLTTTTAGPLAQIFLAQRLSLRTVFYIFHLDGKIPALNNEMPLARQSILPARPYLHHSVNKITMLNSTKTCPSRD